MSGEKRSVSRVTSPISRGLFSSASLVGIHVPIEVRLDGVGAVLGEVEGGERLFQDLALHLFAGLGVDQSDALQELVVGLDRTDPLPCLLCIPRARWCRRRVRSACRTSLPISRSRARDAASSPAATARSSGCY